MLSAALLGVANASHSWALVGNDVQRPRRAEIGGRYVTIHTDAIHGNPSMRGTQSSHHNLDDLAERDGATEGLPPRLEPSAKRFRWIEGGRDCIVYLGHLNRHRLLAYPTLRNLDCTAASCSPLEVRLP